MHSMRTSLLVVVSLGALVADALPLHDIAIPAIPTQMVPIPALPQLPELPTLPELPALHCADHHEDVGHEVTVHVLDVSDVDLSHVLNTAKKVVAVKAGVHAAAKAGVKAVAAAAVLKPFVVAKGLATKGMILAKKAVTAAGRMILKPFAIITGLHLKAIGSGLTMGGKLVGGTGKGIATAGTLVKYAGLGHIGLGASAIGWGLDRSTIDTHFTESLLHKIDDHEEDEPKKYESQEYKE